MTFSIILCIRRRHRDIHICVCVRVFIWCVNKIEISLTNASHGNGSLIEHLVLTTHSRFAVRRCNFSILTKCYSSPSKESMILLTIYWLWVFVYHRAIKSLFWMFKPFWINSNYWHLFNYPCKNASIQRVQVTYKLHILVTNLLIDISSLFHTPFDGICEIYLSNT